MKRKTKALKCLKFVMSNPYLASSLEADGQAGAAAWDPDPRARSGA